MTDTTALEILPIPADPGDLAIEISEQTSTLKTWLDNLYDEVETAGSPDQVLSMIACAKSQVEVLESKMAIAIKLVEDSADVINLLTIQRDEEIENREGLEESIEERIQEAYREGEQHLFECPDCYADLAEGVRENDAEDREETEHAAINNLKTFGNDEGATMLKEKLEEAKRLQEEADEMLNQATTWANEQWRITHNARIEALNNGGND